VHRFNLDDLRAIIRASVGESDDVDLDGPVGETSYAELGYDSLALLEIAARIEQRLGVSMPDGLCLTDTPAATVALVDGLLAEAVGA
jgi:minimal PKS acyl carrier protein